MTDNGSCYKAFDFRDACTGMGLKHVRTKPYTPKTDGKAERFIQTALREWAYAQAYPTSDRRADELPVWLHRHNWHRPPRRHKIKNTNQQTRPDRGQPVEAPHLEHPVHLHRMYWPNNSLPMLNVQRARRRS
jgi:transposase InsO family protein